MLIFEKRRSFTDCELKFKFKVLNKILFFLHMIFGTIINI